jgi:hypothetical protein
MSGIIGFYLGRPMAKGGGVSPRAITEGLILGSAARARFEGWAAPGPIAAQSRGVTISSWPPD